MSEKVKHRCPKCGKAVSLWEGVMLSGYYALDEYLEREGSAEEDRAFEEETGEFGCGECGWTGSREGFQVVGIDGEPLPFVHPNQLEIGS